MNTFVKASLIRAIRTVCQTAAAIIGTATVMSDVNWSMVISASILAGIFSILTSIATGLPEVDVRRDGGIEYEPYDEDEDADEDYEDDDEPDSFDEYDDELYDEEVEAYEH